LTDVLELDESTMSVPLDIFLEVEWEHDLNPCEGRINPVTILSAKFRGLEIKQALHVGHIMNLQRMICECLNER